MLKNFKNGKPNSTELSWEEKNPINYLFQPSRDIVYLRKLSKKESTASDIHKETRRK